MAYDIAVIVGSLRKDSYTRKLVHAMARVAPDALKLSIIEIGTLPLYNQDDEATPTDAVTAFRSRIAKADAVLFATPEYNRSIPGALKNAIDTGSRPYGKSVWSGKPAAVVSASPGALGGFGANAHLRLCLAHMDMPTLGQPEVFLGSVQNAVDADGNFAKPETQEFIVSFLKAFEKWIGRNKD